MSEVLIFRKHTNCSSIIVIFLETGAALVIVQKIHYFKAEYWSCPISDIGNHWQTNNTTTTKRRNNIKYTD